MRAEEQMEESHEWTMAIVFLILTHYKQKLCLDGVCFSFIIFDEWRENIRKEKETDFFKVQVSHTTMWWIMVFQAQILHSLQQDATYTYQA